MAWKDRAVELKVGAFLIASLGVLIAFILVLGNFRFSASHELFIDFPSSGGLREGAKVKIAGVPAGSVREIVFTGGEIRTEKGAPIYVRARIEIDPDMAKSVTTGSKFFVTTEGLLGERYIEVIPGSPEETPIPSGSICAGQSPVELQMVTARAADMLEKVYSSLDKEGQGISALVDDARAMVEHSSSILRQLDAELPGLIEDSRLTLKRAQSSLDRMDSLVDSGLQVVEGQDGVRDLVRSAAGTARQIEDEMPFLLASVDDLLQVTGALIENTGTRIDNVDAQVTSTAAGVRRLVGQATELVSGLEEAGIAEGAKTAISRASDDLTAATGSIRELSLRTEETVAHLSAIASAIREGKGSLGAFLNDREVYDDVRELILDLRKNPWKVLWKP